MLLTPIRLILLLTLFLGFFAAYTAVPEAFAQSKKSQIQKTVYDKQPTITEKELLQFFQLLPKFRAWAHQNHEEAHPSLTNGRPDFFYSNKAAAWIKENEWDPRRFFCVMGKMAAALVIIEEGNDFKGTRPKDMPTVSKLEKELAHRHLAQLLKAGGMPAPTVAVDAPRLPAKH